MAQVPGGGGGNPDYLASEDRTGALGAGGGFRIDADQARSLVDGIQQALAALEQVGQQIDRSSTVAPPGTDPFSSDATEKFGRTAAGGADDLLSNHQAFVDVLVTTRDQIQAGVAALVAQDAANTSSLGNGDSGA